MIDAATFDAPNWVDLSTTDVAAASRFYSELFGWDIAVTSSPMGDYHVAKVAGAEVAGMMAQSPELAGSPPTWNVFIFVEDIDKTMELVESAAGTILTPPFEIPGGARVGVIADPSGAIVALIAGGETPDGVFLATTPGAVCWVELMTRDPEVATPFYRDVFGWEAVVDDATAAAYTMFRLDGDDVAGMLLMPDEVPVEAPSHWAVYFATDDCDEVCAKVQALGGKVLRDAMDIAVGRFAVLEDPQGAVFDVMELDAATT